jgi:hypothetical protein
LEEVEPSRLGLIRGGHQLPESAIATHISVRYTAKISECEKIANMVEPEDKDA